MRTVTGDYSIDYFVIVRIIISRCYYCLCVIKEDIYEEGQVMEGIFLIHSLHWTRQTHKSFRSNRNFSIVNTHDMFIFDLMNGRKTHPEKYDKFVFNGRWPLIFVVCLCVVSAIDFLWGNNKISGISVREVIRGLINSMSPLW